MFNLSVFMQTETDLTVLQINVTLILYGLAMCNLFDIY